MSIHHAQARHRAVPTRSNPFEAVSKAVSSHAGSVGRGAAVIAATSGLILGLAAPSQAYAPEPPSSASAAANTGVKSTTVPASKTYKAKRSSLSSASSFGTSRTSSKPGYSRAASYTAKSPAKQTATVQRQAAAETRTSVRTTAKTIIPRSATTPKVTSAPTAKTTSVQPASSAKSGSIASMALAYEGSGYVYGGQTPGAWDCSGFVKYVYGKAGVDLPHNTTAIRTSGKFVPTSNPSPGDLVYQNGGSHVGIYIGGGKIIGAQNPSAGTVIREADSVYGPLMGYYTLAV